MSLHVWNKSLRNVLDENGAHLFKYLNNTLWFQATGYFKIFLI